MTNIEAASFPLFKDKLLHNLLSTDQYRTAMFEKMLILLKLNFALRAYVHAMCACICTKFVSQFLTLSDLEVEHTFKVIQNHYKS